MPAGTFFVSIYCKRAPLICPRSLFFPICLQKSSLNMPAGFCFGIFCKRAPLICPQGPFFEYFVKVLAKYSRRGLLGEIFDKLRIHLGNIKNYVSRYLFRVWYMQSEAFQFEKSFQHTPKPSKHIFYIVLNDYNVKKCHNRTNVEKQFCPVL